MRRSIDFPDEPKKQRHMKAVNYTVNNAMNAFWQTKACVVYPSINMAKYNENNPYRFGVINPFRPCAHPISFLNHSQSTSVCHLSRFELRHHGRTIYFLFASHLAQSSLSFQPLTRQMFR